MSTAIDGTGGTLTSPADDRGFFGHPRGLSTLFFTEMWERFSYYGMKAILTLYMTKSLVEGGLGFDEKYADRIFTLFERLHGRSAYEGTGIGLAICRKIAQRHGGEIRARSEGDWSSIVTIYLPTRENDDRRRRPDRRDTRSDRRRKLA